jgi:photosystem II stability/assembly factor-like uncharacterized protein
MTNPRIQLSILTLAGVCVLAFAIHTGHAGNRAAVRNSNHAAAGPSGRQWHWQNPLPQGNDLHGASFVDADTGTVVGAYGTIVRTTDGGSTWTIQSSGTTENLWAVSFTDATNGTAIGEARTILRTTDAGAHWVSQVSGTTFELRGVSFTDANNGTAVGAVGTILRTTDAGNTWVPQTSGTKYDLWGVSFTDANTGTAVGGTPLVDEGIILRTTDGGNTWVPQSNPGVFLSDVSFSDANNGTAVGDRGHNPENHRWWKQLGTSNKRDYHVAIWRFVHRCEQRDDCRIRIIWRPRYNSQNNGWRRPLG